jgi:hypothetical protein
LNEPLIHPPAFLRALLPPILIWGAWMMAATLGGYPGVACVTPVAWLLALHSGTQYALATAGRTDRWPALGPALLGAVLGLYEGLLFMFSANTMMAGETRPEEFARARALGAVMLAGSVIACTLFSTFTGWLTRRRLARHG